MTTVPWGATRPKVRHNIVEGDDATVSDEVTVHQEILLHAIV